MNNRASATPGAPNAAGSEAPEEVKQEEPDVSRSPKERRDMLIKGVIRYGEPKYGKPGEHERERHDRRSCFPGARNGYERYAHSGSGPTGTRRYRR